MKKGKAHIRYSGNSPGRPDSVEGVVSFFFIAWWKISTNVRDEANFSATFFMFTLRFEHGTPGLVPRSVSPTNRAEDTD